MRDLPQMVCAGSPPDRQTANLRQSGLSKRTASSAMPAMEPEKPRLFQSQLFERQVGAHQGPACIFRENACLCHTCQPHRAMVAQASHGGDHRGKASGHFRIYHRADHGASGEKILFDSAIKRRRILRGMIGISHCFYV